jgi:hypothetical protein
MVSSIYQQLQTWSILREPIMVVEGLKIKPYLLGDTSYASWCYLLRNFKPVDGNLEKSCSTNKWMLVGLALRMLLGFLKIGGGSCIASMHVLIELPEFWWLVLYFTIIVNWRITTTPKRSSKRSTLLCKGASASFSWRSSHVTTWRNNAYCTFHKLDDYLHQPHLMFFMTILEI